MISLHISDSGWRAVTADGFTVDRLSAIVKSLARLHPDSPRTLIGFDNRFLSREFAHHAAFVLEKEGWRPEILTDLFPTPGVAALVKTGDYDWGLVVTASHNPYYYNGLKILDKHGTLIDRSLADPIEKKAKEILESEPPPAFELKRQFSKVLDSASARESYFAEICRHVDTAAIRKAGLKIAWDAFGGTVDSLFQPFLESLGVRGERFPTPVEPTYGGRRLEPDETSLADLGALVKEKTALAGLATDVDGDRFSAVDETGAYVQNNPLGSLMAWYLLACRKEKGTVYQTVSCSALTERICGEFGVPLTIEPVGFMQMGRHMVNDKAALIGMEETGGLAYGPHLPFKDGLMAHALVLEMLATQGKTIPALIDDLRKKYGRFYYKRIDLMLPSQTEADHWMDPALWERKTGEVVQQTSPLDGVKWFFPSGWVLIRRSKTEPLLRIYFESKDASFIERIAKEVSRPMKID